jgi:hypothetical protein
LGQFSSGTLYTAVHNNDTYKCNAKSSETKVAQKLLKVKLYNSIISVLEYSIFNFYVENEIVHFSDSPYCIALRAFVGLPHKCEISECVLFYITFKLQLIPTSDLAS